jgi:hypothetical protein
VTGCRTLGRGEGISCRVVPGRYNTSVKRNALLAATFNAVLYGVGYLYLGKKTAFAVLVLLADIMAGWALLASSSSFSFGDFRLDLAFLVLSAAFGLDAYQLAKDDDARSP